MSSQEYWDSVGKERIVVNSHSNSQFILKRLVNGIFQILHAIEPKAMQVNPEIYEDLDRVETSINNDTTLEQIEEEELEKYYSLVEEILDIKRDICEIDTSNFENSQ